MADALNFFFQCLVERGCGGHASFSLKLGRLVKPKRRTKTTTAHTILVAAVHAPGRQHHEIVIDSTLVAVFCVEKWSLVLVLWSTTGVRNCGVRGETDGGSGTHHRRTPHSVQWPSPIFFTWRGEVGIRLVGSAKRAEPVANEPQGRRRSAGCCLRRSARPHATAWSPASSDSCYESSGRRGRNQRSSPAPGAVAVVGWVRTSSVKKATAPSKATKSAKQTAKGSPKKSTR